MRKVAGRLKLELSRYRELEAFAQFGSDLDQETQRTLARGERLVKTLNQAERHPIAVEEQVIQIYAATNGYLDRIVVDKVERFLADLTDNVRGNEPELLKKIAEGDWSDETQEQRRGGRASSSPRTSASIWTRRAIRSTTRWTSQRAGPSGHGRNSSQTRMGRRSKRRSHAARPIQACHRLSATFATVSAPSRTSRRSPTRCSWSPPRACAALSSGSRRCGPTRARSA